MIPIFNQNIDDKAYSIIFIIEISFTISTGIAPNSKDGTMNINITLNIPANAPPWYKDVDKNNPYNPSDTFSPSIK